MWILKEIYEDDNIVHLRVELDCNEDPEVVSSYLNRLYPHAEIEIVGYEGLGNKFHIKENIGIHRNVVNVVGKKDAGIRTKYLFRFICFVIVLF